MGFFLIQMLIDSKDKNIAFHIYINNWILHIYYNMLRNIDENYDKKIYQWNSDWWKLVEMLRKTSINDNRHIQVI